MTNLAEIWVYLAREPLAALTATLLAWLAAQRLARAARFHPMANPVLFAVALLVTRKANRNTHFAFGPFLIVGTLIAVLR